MSKKNDFIDYINSLNLDMPDNVADFWKAFSTSASEVEKPALTEKGVEVLKYIRANSLSMFKSRDIAEGMGLASRSVSGTLTKMKNDGFLERLSESPAIYSLTDKGNTFEI